MPNKAHRAASRQAQLQRKRRRGKARTQELEQGDAAPTSVITATEPPAVAEVRAEPVPEASAPVAQPARRARERALPDPQPDPLHRYLGAELRKIGMLATLMVVILVGLTFVLRS